jgi:formylglycine-generating enzyme required for sulfatase activity
LGLLFMMLFACQESPPPDLNVPTNLNLAIDNSQQIALSWGENSQGETAYLIERRDTSDFFPIATLPENTSAYVDLTACYGLVNHYRVSVMDAEGGSLFTEDSVGFVFLETEWCTIPGGEYHYGENGSLQNDLNEDYQMMTFEVTNSQFVTFLNEAIKLGTITVPGSLPIGEYEGDAHWPAAHRMAADVNDPDSRMSWNGVEFVADLGHENKPVSEVPWFGAYFFARHYSLSLPTEREWEKAARGLNDDPYPWGADPLSCELANTAGCGARLIDVGTTDGASPFGVRDMIGNVWEWVDDFMAPDDPHRVLKGGSCNSTTHTTYVHSRNHDDAWHTSYFYGFRCIKRK